MFDIVFWILAILIVAAALAVVFLRDVFRAALALILLFLLIAGIYVTDYYDMELIQAHTTVFVIGSDVYGPMGRELIPLKNAADARQFMTDHKGRHSLGFSAVTPELIKPLDE